MNKPSASTKMRTGGFGLIQGKVMRRFRLALGILLAAFVAAISSPAMAVPSFADQTGQPCQACHVGGIGPQLTPFGREFKLDGYVMRAKKSMPFAVMAIASVTHTRNDQDPPPDHFGPNDNIAFDQGSIFLAGGAGQHFGAFAQITYDGVERHWAWDNIDLRVVTKGQIFGADATFGLDVNNSPTVQDAWNTAPAWSFPYTDTAVSPTPGASPLIDEHLAQNTIGITAYAWIGRKVYLEAGGYKSPGQGFLNAMGADPADPGDIAGVAPYARVAYQAALGGGTAHLGGFFLKANINPGRDRSSGASDHFTDVGVDASWYRAFGNNDTLTANIRYVHEVAHYEASCRLGLIGQDGSPDCSNVTLNELRADVAYYWRNKVGGTLGLFRTTGTANPNLYEGPAEKPDSSGLTLQLDYTPWGDGTSPLGKLFNIRFGLQYTSYFKFDGARHNYDGAGAEAANNNSLRFFTWLAF